MKEPDLLPTRPNVLALLLLLAASPLAAATVLI